MYMIAEVSQYVAVASFTEAWIEILEEATILLNALDVASFTEAWIEIEEDAKELEQSASPPSRRRGLKFLNISALPFSLVASFAEARIEILHIIFFNLCNESPPSRRRGLKYSLVIRKQMVILSPPSRRRGLKSFVFCLRDHFFQGRLLGNRQGFMF